MHSKRKWFLLLVPVVGLGFLLSSMEPRSRGHSLSFWLESVTEPDLATPAPSDPIDAVREIGAKAVPVLLTKLQANDSAWKAKVAEVAKDHDWFRNNNERASEQPYQAVMGFRILGAQGRSALPELGTLMFNTNTAMEAALALAGIGSDGVPLLRSGLTNSAVPIRRAAIDALSTSPELARLGLPDMPRLLQDPDSEVAQTALNQIAWVAPLEQSMPVLTNALGNPRFQLAAIRRLGALGTNARAAALFLMPLLKQETHPLRARILTNAIKSIDPNAFSAVRKNADVPLQ